MQALVVAPGGFGTCDELFELMTLKQTGKMQQALPIVLLGKKYWQETINWNTFAEYGVINPADVDELLFTDSVQEVRPSSPADLPDFATHTQWKA